MTLRAAPTGRVRHWQPVAPYLSSQTVNSQQSTSSNIVRSRRAADTTSFAAYAIRLKIVRDWTSAVRAAQSSLSLRRPADSGHPTGGSGHPAGDSGHPTGGRRQRPPDRRQRPPDRRQRPPGSRAQCLSQWRRRAEVELWLH